MCFWFGFVVETCRHLATMRDKTTGFCPKFQTKSIQMSEPSFSQLTAEAEKTVAAARRRLPPEVARHAKTLPVAYHDWPSEEILGGEFEPDILGLFVGDPLGVEPGLGNNAPAHILLFLENIFDYADFDMAVFREEVRITYLHELGHYLGWDEGDLEARGLE